MNNLTLSLVTETPTTRSTPTQEFQQLATQVSGFFGSLMKEVKTLSNDAAGKVEGFVNRLQTGSEPSSASSAHPPSSTRSGGEDEEYELQMALAMSLSLQDSQKLDDDTILELQKDGVPVDALLDGSAGDLLVDTSEQDAPAEHTSLEPELKKVVDTSVNNDSLI